MSIGAISSGSWQTSSLYGSQSASERPPTIEEMLSELDVDASGDLSLEESGLSEEQFTSLDVDGDGVLTESDHEALLSQMQGRFGGGQPPIDPASLDTDENGEISEEESGLSSEEFTAMDIDGDGVLTEADFEAMKAQMEGETMDAMAPPPPQDASEVVSELDADADGQLSQEEMGMSSTEFDELDTNQDGFVSQEELEAARQTMKQDKAGSGFLGSYAMSAYQAQNAALTEASLTSFGQGLSIAA
ncbi:putative signal transduction protein with EFhand domain protein [Desulfarculus baarsii DSM 2075]|uniref:Signal transduction protein with EFhand domain protein n=1 Tax=Desulfarculus baarsii (strain ATCC 33931 / DSM 2075 / LMG 7858 / VKM B-1802 / 2st14) TaxID=644282 RepID=E1QLV6_DESB2|nr:signal transduction protein with EFhand domain-containing protein [Desulfarculus baarsii]ADK86541.1 putative signal transduction protein with EFhand domain protein [Desulfarculus baarsii DSM 2075]